MIKSQIINKLNQEFSQRRFESELNYNIRLTKAMQIKEFNDLIVKERSLKIHLYTANETEKQNIQIELTKICKALLEIIRKYKIDLNVYYQCPKCKDLGFVKGEMCDCYKNELNNAIRINSNLPLNSANCTLDNFLDPKISHAAYLNKIYSKCKEWTENFDTTKKQILFLCGDVGVGKTTLSYAIANRLIEDNKSVYYSTMFALNTLFTDKQFNRFYDEDALNTAIHSDLLIIDDLGTEVSNAIGLEYLFNLIDNRTANYKKTIICTNLNMKQFISRYGERVFSRLTDSNYAFAPRYIEGVSLRKK